jgi:hypothetical protein
VINTDGRKDSVGKTGQADGSAETCGKVGGGRGVVLARIEIKIICIICMHACVTT